MKYKTINFTNLQIKKIKYDCTHQMFIMPGLVSRGPGCARAHHPGIYTRVLDFKSHQNIPEKNQGEVPSSLDLFNCLAACEVQGGAKG